MKDLLLALASFALVGCAATDDAKEEPGTGSADESIINGQTASAYPEAALIDTSSYVCSGSVIAPRVVLTAGHCVAARQYRVRAPFVGATASATQVWTPYQTTGEYVNTRSIDVGVIVLDQPINLPSYPVLSQDPVANGTKVVNVGRIRNGRISSTQLFVGQAVTVRDASSNGFPYAYIASDIIESGDSGGPVYAGSGTRREIVAVNSGAGGRTEVLARVDLVYDQIQQIIAMTQR